MHQKFPKIRGFANIARDLNYTGEDTPDKIWFGTKVKLHGTNSGIRIDADGTVTGQARNRDIDPAKPGDHFGFSGFVQEHAGFFQRYQPTTFKSVVIYGEWAGPGVQKKVAVSLLNKKYFFVFAIKFVNGEGDHWMIDPHLITSYLGYADAMLPAPDEIRVVPWYSTVCLDTRYQDDAQRLVDELNKAVAVIDVCDPYIHAQFGVSGIGEGLVVYPLLSDNTTAELERLIFKVKGGSHSASGGAKPARIKPLASKDVFDFADQTVTDDRMEQALQESGATDIGDTGRVIGWVCRDVATESVDELEASGLDWKQVQGVVATRAREWFHRHLDQVVFPA